MRVTVQAGFLSLLVTAVFAQQRSLSVGLPVVGPIPPLGGQARVERPSPIHHQPVRPIWPVGFPIYWPGYGAAYVPPLTVVVVQPAFPAPRLKPPREPAKSEIREYGKSPEAGREDPAVFSLALVDGVVYSAVAVWLVGDALQYIDEDGVRRQAFLRDIDRAATQRLNKAKGLILRLPAPAGG